MADKPESKFNIEAPRQYKSPDSDNVYTIIAENPDMELGISVKTYKDSYLVFRFCIFADDKPNVKVFSMRGNPKNYTQYPTGEEKVTRVGAGLDKVDVRILQSSGTKDEFLNAIKDDAGWIKFAAWINEALKKENLGLLMSEADFADVLPLLLSGMGINKAKSDIQYPQPVGMKAVKPVKVCAEPEGGEDDDHDE